MVTTLALLSLLHFTPPNTTDAELADLGARIATLEQRLHALDADLAGRDAVPVALAAASAMPLPLPRPSRVVAPTLGVLALPLAASAVGVPAGLGGLVMAGVLLTPVWNFLLVTTAVLGGAALVGLVIAAAVASAPSRLELQQQRRDLDQQRLSLSSRRNQLLRQKVFGDVNTAGDDAAAETAGADAAPEAAAVTEVLDLAPAAAPAHRRTPLRPAR